MRANLIETPTSFKNNIDFFNGCKHSFGCRSLRASPLYYSSRVPTINHIISYAHVNGLRWNMVSGQIDAHSQKVQPTPRGKNVCSEVCTIFTWPRNAKTKNIKKGASDFYLKFAKIYWKFLIDFDMQRKSFPFQRHLNFPTHGKLRRHIN